MRKLAVVFTLAIVFLVLSGCVDVTTVNETDGDEDGDQTVADGDEDSSLPDGDLDDEDLTSDGDTEQTDSDGEISEETEDVEPSPLIRVSPQKLDINELNGCCGMIEPLNIYNLSERDLSITDISLSENEIVELKLLNPELPIQLAKDSDVRVKVQLCSTSVGETEEQLTFTFADETDYSINVFADISEQPVVTDTFKTLSKRLIDMLLVVDCSGSMAEEHTVLKNSFAKFINNTEYDKLDMNIAVISCDVTDENHSGRFQGDPAVLNTENLTKEQLITSFNQTIDGLGTGCDPTNEAGLDAFLAALTEPLISTHNSGFLREDAKLVSIFLSDEEDTSTSYEETSFYVDFAVSIKGARNVNMLETFAIVGDEPDGCSGYTGDADSGSRYIFFAKACNYNDDSSFLSVCLDDYSPVFNSFTDNFFILRQQFFLSRMPDTTTLVVKVGDEEVSGWKYDEASNSIIFDDTPPPDTTITVTYNLICICK